MEVIAINIRVMVPFEGDQGLCQGMSTREALESDEGLLLDLDVVTWEFTL